MNKNGPINKARKLSAVSASYITLLNNLTLWPTCTIFDPTGRNFVDSRSIAQI
jgi:hypothetical protein